MNCNVVHGGEEVFNAMINAPPTRTFLDNLDEEIRNISASVSNIPQTFMARLKAARDSIVSGGVLNRAKSILNKSGRYNALRGVHSVDFVTPIMPSVDMQNYIISNPVVNELYRDNMCDGYSDTMGDPEPDSYGKYRNAYRRAVTGILQFEDDDEGQGYIVDYSSDDDIELCDSDKFSIRETWDIVEKMILEGDDPTDLSEL